VRRILCAIALGLCAVRPAAADDRIRVNIGTGGKHDYKIAL